MKVTVFPLAFYILLKNQEIRGTGRVLSQIASPVATNRRNFGGNIWNIARFVVSLQCLLEQTTSERQYV
jgi:hypothetical protein